MNPWSKSLKAACSKSIPGILITNKASSSIFKSCVSHHQPPPLQVHAQVGSCLLCRFAAFSHRATFLLNRYASQDSCVLCLSCYYIERAATSLWITTSSFLLCSPSFVLPCTFVMCMWPFSSPRAKEWRIYVISDFQTTNLNKRVRAKEPQASPKAHSIAWLLTFLLFMFSPSPFFLPSLPFPFFLLLCFYSNSVTVSPWNFT